MLMIFLMYITLCYLIPTYKELKSSYTDISSPGILNRTYFSATEFGCHIF